MTGKVERGWLILPQRYSTLKLQTNVHSTNRDEYYRTEFLIKSLRDTSNASDAEILENVGEILLRFVAEVSWQMNRVHVAANAMCGTVSRNAPRWSISLKAG